MKSRESLRSFIRATILRIMDVQNHFIGVKSYYQKKKKE